MIYFIEYSELHVISDFLYINNYMISVVMQLSFSGEKVAKADTLGSSGLGMDGRVPHRVFIA